MFYDVKKKNVIWIGSSTIGNHCILANIHVEEIALKKINQYLKHNQLKSKNIKNIKIILFKIKYIESKYIIKSAFCCNWCYRLLKRYKFPLCNIITPNDTNIKFISSINESHKYKIPLKKIDINTV